MSLPEPKFQGLSKTDIEKSLSYDPETGVFTRVVDGHGAWKAGQVAGSVNPSGYVVVYVNSVRMLAHRLAWFLETGEVPAEVEHRNRTRADNRFCNLRTASRSQNMANASARTGGTSKHKGVYFCEKRKTYRAKIHREGKTIFLGSFQNEDDAGRAYDKAALRHSGEFANLNFPAEGTTP